MSHEENIRARAFELAIKAAEVSIPEEHRSLGRLLDLAHNIEYYLINGLEVIKNG